MSTEVTFWHSAEYGSDFRPNSGEIPRNSAEFRGISRNFAEFRGISRNFAEFRRNLAEITSEVKKFRGIPCWRNSVDTLPGSGRSKLANEYRIGRIGPGISLDVSSLLDLSKRSPDFFSKDIYEEMLMFGGEHLSLST